MAHLTPCMWCGEKLHTDSIFWWAAGPGYIAQCLECHLLATELYKGKAPVEKGCTPPKGKA